MIRVSVIVLNLMSNISQWWTLYILFDSCILLKCYRCIYFNSPNMNLMICFRSFVRSFSFCDCCFCWCYSKQKKNFRFQWSFFLSTYHLYPSLFPSVSQKKLLRFWVFYGQSLYTSGRYSQWEYHFKYLYLYLLSAVLTFQK